MKPRHQSDGRGHYSGSYVVNITAFLTRAFAKLLWRSLRLQIAIPAEAGIQGML